ncbi:MAG: adenylate/guanylate cyclase domain-containing protein [Arenicellales bacterium]
MVGDRRSGKLAVILHADIAGSTALVQQDERLAHERIQEVFHRFGDIIAQYHGRVRELRGDALLAEFERASDAVTAALALQTDQSKYNAQLDDNIRPSVRVGIAMGEVIIADNTVTGAGVVLAQRVEQLAEPGGVVIQGAAYETIPGRFPFAYTDLGERLRQTRSSVLGKFKKRHRYPGTRTGRSSSPKYFSCIRVCCYCRSWYCPFLD